MQKQRMIVGAIAITAAIGLGFMIGQYRRSEDLTTPVVRTYNTQPERIDELKAQLNHLLEQKDAPNLGRVQTFTSGLVIVRAPEGYQRGIGRLIDLLEKTPPSPRRAIQLRLWIVTGTDDKESNASAFGALANVLTSITKIDGARKFRVLEHLGTNETNGFESKIKGQLAEVISTAYINGENLNLKLDVRGKLGELKTDMQIKPGEFLVLGQNSADASVRDGKMSGGSANVYYIVRAEVLN